MKLRYVILPANRIFNRLGIENLTAWLAFGPSYAESWWTPEIVQRRQEFAEIWIKEFDKMTGHFSLLEKSMKEVGMLSPVSTVSGPARDRSLSNPNPNKPSYFPPDTPLSQVIYTQPFGGSRVTIAERLGIEVPCVVHDFSNLFPDAPVVTTKNFKKWFPTGYTFTASKPHLRLNKHSHIQDKKYDGMNNNTRTAQRQASAVAKKKLGL